MHELSIAMSLIDVAAEEAGRRGVVAVAIHMRLGPLSGVVRDALLSAFELAREGSPLAGVRLVIRDMPVVAWCPACRREQQIESVQRLCCPACHTPTPDVRGGRELDVVGLEILDGVTDASVTDTSVTDTSVPDAHGRSAAEGAQAE